MFCMSLLTFSKELEHACPLSYYGCNGPKLIIADFILTFCYHILYRTGDVSYKQENILTVNARSIPRIYKAL